MLYLFAGHQANKMNKEREEEAKKAREWADKLVAAQSGPHCIGFCEEMDNAIFLVGTEKSEDRNLMKISLCKEQTLDKTKIAFLSLHKKDPVFLEAGELLKQGLESLDGCEENKGSTSSRDKEMA